MGNISYASPELEKHFSSNRVKWGQFYESERVVIESVWPSQNPAVLDIGCGCGGLGLALRERFGADGYTGIEINAAAAASAARLYPEADIRTGDFLAMSESDLPAESFDVVFSLSCIDWNCAFDEMLVKAWSMVKPGGVFIASFRLTTEPGMDDLKRSYQYINYEGKREGEIAAYVVLNAAGLADRLVALGVGNVFAYGYFGPPSSTAVTPFSELCFAALAARKQRSGGGIKAELHLPNAVSEMMAERFAKAT